MPHLSVKRKIISLFLLALPFMAFSDINYEPNNSLNSAKPITINDAAQAHKFDYAGDEDWFVFYAQENTPYDIEIESSSVGEGINPALTLYDEEGEIESPLFDFNFSGEGELLSWMAPESGFYFIKVTNEEDQFDVDGHYNIKVFLPFAPQNGKIEGQVVDQCTQVGIAKAAVMTEVKQVFSHFRGVFIGQYSLIVDPGTYTVNARAEGYQENSLTVEVKELTVTPLNFQLIPNEGCSVPSSIDDEILGETPNEDISTSDIEEDRQDIISNENTPSAEELIVLKEQSVGVFDEVSGLLTLKDVRIGNDVITATLQKQDDFSFKLVSTEDLTQGVFNSPAFYNHDTLLADIPQVFAFNKLYAVKLKKISDDWVYKIEKLDPLSF